MLAIPERESPPPRPGGPRPALSTSTRILWGAGGLTDLLVVKGVFGLCSEVYTIALGYSPLLFAFAIAAVRLVDSFTDPVIGYLSDNTTSRWGRRRPWMLAGLIISALIAVAVNFPPHVPKVGAGIGWLEAWHLQWQGILFLFAMMVGLNAIGYSCYVIPYTGMGYELTDNYNERTHLFKWRMLAYALGGFISPWLPYFAMRIEGPTWEVHKGAVGAHFVGLAIALMILASGLLPILFCRERIHVQGMKRKIGFLEALKETLSCRAFWPILVANFVIRFAMITTGVFFFYVFAYHIARGNIKDGAAYLGVFFNSINIANFAFGLVFVARMSDRLGKKTALLICLAVSAIAYATFGLTASNANAAFVTLPIWGGASMTFQWPCIITGVLVGVFTNTMPMVMNSMVADVCDLDELTTGQRRDAFFGAVLVSSDKFAMCFATAFQGILLVWTGFDATKSIQAADAVHTWIRMLVITQPAGFIIGFVCILYYPLTYVRWTKVRTALDARGP